MAVSDITEAAQWETDVIGSSTPVFVDFWAEWCGPCRMVGPIVDEISGEYEGKVKFVKVNVDKAGEISSRYNVFSIPTMILFKNGEIVKQQVGAASKDQLKKIIDEAV